MDFKLELIIVPVSDVDRAKAFYSENAGFNVDVDFSADGGFRIVQLTPPGSACSITLMHNADRAGSLEGLHLVVSDMDLSRRELLDRGLAVGEPYHFDNGSEAPGPDPERRDYGTFMSFKDPDGNGWVVQEVRSRAASSAS